MNNETHINRACMMKYSLPFYYLKSQQVHIHWNVEQSMTVQILCRPTFLILQFNKFSKCIFKFVVIQWLMTKAKLGSCKLRPNRFLYLVYHVELWRLSWPLLKQNTWPNLFRIWCWSWFLTTSVDLIQGRVLNPSSFISCHPWESTMCNCEVCPRLTRIWKQSGCQPVSCLCL